MSYKFSSNCYMTEITKPVLHINIDTIFPEKTFFDENKVYFHPETFIPYKLIPVTIENGENNKVVEKTDEAELNTAYKENMIIEDVRKHILRTYDEHYVFGEARQLFDDWIDEGNANITFRHTAQKYLKRYGLKDGKNKKDIMKAIHYLVMLLYVDHYQNL